MKIVYRAIRCPCGHRACKSWMVDPVAAVQGVRFDERQARSVANLLNTMENDSSYVFMTHGPDRYVDEPIAPGVRL